MNVINYIYIKIQIYYGDRISDASLISFLSFVGIFHMCNWKTLNLQQQQKNITIILAIVYNANNNTRSVSFGIHLVQVIYSDTKHMFVIFL